MATAATGAALEKLATDAGHDLERVA